MTGSYLLAILFCTQVILTANGRPVGDDGEWMDDVSLNPDIMGLNDEDDNDLPRSAPTVEDNGEWVDDVTGNMFIMGEDPLSQSTGLSDDANGRKKRDVGKKILKLLKKASKKLKREVIDTLTVEREKKSPTKIKLEKTLLQTMKKP
ncbi:Uncharacterized protein APZ42_016069 [Daphnia magna]|uniref:Uncharacterized protein n=1 Tax=Daphnia magna TaxID=35525 RepID=A0A0N7ZIU8_9CRUS|nr:Uncharacterized protein APZ42_016069 [Daphnia magna]